MAKQQETETKPNAPKKGCIVEGCERKHDARGYCRVHYGRFMRHGSFDDQRQIYAYNVAAFTNEDAVSYYLLGAFCSDGSLSASSEWNSQTCSISSKDRDWLEIIRSYVCPEKPIYRKIRKDGTESFMLSFHNREICQWLIGKGCTSNKSLTLEFPVIPKRYLYDFIRGMWDGDGTIAFYRWQPANKRHWRVSRAASMVSGSVSFIEGMCENLASLGMQSSCSTKKRKGNGEIRGEAIDNSNPTHCLYLSSGEDVYRFAKCIYPVGTTLTLSRKYEAAQQIIADWEREFRCEECGVVLVVGKMERNTKCCEPCRKTIRDRQNRESKTRSKERRAAKKKLS